MTSGVTQVVGLTAVQSSGGGGGGSGTVTNVATDATLTGGPITTTGTLGIATNAAIPGSPTTTTQATTDNSTKVATTAYVTTAVANAVAGVNPAVAVQAATTAAGNTSALTYSNGASGIGATFTGAVNTALTVDGYTFTALGQRLLVKNDTQSPSGAFNGVYYVTQIQTAILPIILTRALDYDMPSDINNTGAIPVINGTVNALTSWLLTSAVATVGTDPLTYSQFSYNNANLTSNAIVTGTGGAGLQSTGIIVSAGTISQYQDFVNTKADSYALVSADTGTAIYFTNSSAAILTCPKTMPVGFVVEIFQYGTAQVTFTAATSAAVLNRRSLTKTAGQYAACSLKVLLNADGTNAQYVLAGDVGA